MKKFLLLTFAIGIMSCANDEVSTTPPPPPLDCTCDKVVEVATFNIIGTPQNPQITLHSVYTTINVCTQVQRQKTHNTYFQNEVPVVGQCR